MLDFPDERGYEVSQDGTDLIRPGCSVGMNRLLGKLKEWASTDSSPRWKMILLNGATVFRNIYASGKPEAQLRAEFMQDCEILTLYMEAYIAHTSKGIPRIPIVVYLPDYGRLPKKIIREANPEEVAMGKAFAHMAHNSFISGPKLSSQGVYTDRWVLPVGIHDLPEKEIVSWIHKTIISGELGTYQIRDPVCIITHCPVDLHIHRRLSGVQLWESYTAVVKNPDRFGSKLVSEKEARIPFTTVTHRVFGDSIHVAPLIKGRKRTELKERANTSNWMTASDSRILRDIQMSVDVSASELASVHF